MINYVEDIFGEPVNSGDTVIVSRPSGAGGSSYLELCVVHKVNDKSVSLQPINRDGTPAMETWRAAPQPKAKFSVTKSNYRTNTCSKIVRYNP